MDTFTISGNIIDVLQQRIYPGTLHIRNGVIEKITEEDVVYGQYILPGFTDAHVHVESSMLVPSEFARLAVVHGTVATVSDPHEIANVLGVKGVEFMLDNGRQVPFKFNFGAPSCVPATAFETAGAEINVEDVDRLLQRDDVKYLSEMMNFPGVLQQDPAVMQKIAAAKKYNKPVDGHAPGLRGEKARQYIAAGISTDHECFTREEALDKLQYGMKILIREGSAAKNFEALIGLLQDHPDEIMFCSDDKHPDSLVEGHINTLVKRALAKGISLMKVLKAACVNPVLHYHLPVGLLQENDPADFIVVNDPEELQILHTYINGELVASGGRSLISSVPVSPVNHFHCRHKKPEDFRIVAKEQNSTVRVIEALDGQLITNALRLPVTLENNCLTADIKNDIVKLAVVNRYHDAPVATAFIRNTGLQRGAIASSVAHDSHNIIVAGVDDEAIARAVNLLIDHQGGICVMDNDTEEVLPLPVAGLMSAEDGYTVAARYAALDTKAKSLGSKLQAPFMTLSFMALLVIPHLKLSDKGLFDGDAFRFVNTEIS